MGKMIHYLTLLIFIDLFFLVTGQYSILSPTSLIVDTLLNISNITGLSFYLLIFGTAGIAGIAVVAGVSTGIINKAGIDILAFVSVALGLAALVGDFVSIYVYLASYNDVLALFVMGPIIILFLMTVVEWLRGKD